MKQDILQEIKKLKGILPDNDFTKRSRFSILSSPQKQNLFSFSQFSEMFNFSLSLALTALLVIGTIGGVKYLQKSPLPLKLAGLDSAILKAEAESFGIDVKISKLAYQEQKNTEIQKALQETANNNPVYFEKIILDKETENMTLDSLENPLINKALDELVK
ncbi:MAG: hypothetical protein A2430_02475 [Candidatus Liptonbacteria bacterium RIFOXYC1_FULL_36_8]|uniref:Uncharacterized protein n=3 Tax=Candidatus Liptoniibacteriota TaxID=1817909 RepID=A0A1G2CNF4_9BACT|nr:MAG: hypothetical protein A2390_00305 [Candidatus Liptonbacteria bacterium RIFOXYB1_FULL_36_10]OGZ03280.1 MAG: hypothetical protein A2604_02835 [Candidatus Liptonbacteria bacterium RIFOXYD1_FULL_36_11]OGZ03642.1 MAG: hypothetical protein A2430_02475 [Candidatus Liptonbacteria bacterium RIFOXYC1_FULL_36_8]